MPDEEIVADYELSQAAMDSINQRIMADPVRSERNRLLPNFTQEAAPKAMRVFLSSLRGEYGSMRGYVEAQGGDDALFQQLENVLLE